MKYTLLIFALFLFPLPAETASTTPDVQSKAAFFFLSKELPEGASNKEPKKNPEIKSLVGWSFVCSVLGLVGVLSPLLRIALIGSLSLPGINLLMWGIAFSFTGVVLGVMAYHRLKENTESPRKRKVLTIVSCWIGGIAGLLTPVFTMIRHLSDIFR